SRARLVRQLLMESLLLAAAGAALGAGLASVLSRAMIAFISTTDTHWVLGTDLDWRTLGFTGGLAALTCILFGLAPAMRATHLSPPIGTRTLSPTGPRKKEPVSVRRLLVRPQGVFSLVLLTGSILFVRSLHNLLTTDAGFNAEGIATIYIDFTRANYPKDRRI